MPAVPSKICPREHAHTRAHTGTHASSPTFSTSTLVDSLMLLEHLDRQFYVIELFFGEITSAHTPSSHSCSHSLPPLHSNLSCPFCVKFCVPYPMTILSDLYISPQHFRWSGVLYISLTYLAYSLPLFARTHVPSR